MKIIFILVVRITRPFHATLKIVPMKKYVLFVLKRLHFSIESIRPLATKVRVPLNQQDNLVIIKLQFFGITIFLILSTKIRVRLIRQYKSCPSKIIINFPIKLRNFVSNRIIRFKDVQRNPCDQNIEIHLNQEYFNFERQITDSFDSTL